MSDSTVIDKQDSVVTVTDPAIDARAREKIVTARIGLLLKAPFFGQLTSRLELVNADAWCPTAATDGKNSTTTPSLLTSYHYDSVSF